MTTSGLSFSPEIIQALSDSSWQTTTSEVAASNDELFGQPAAVIPFVYVSYTTA